MKDMLPGRVWSRGDKHVLVRTGDQKAETFAYLLKRQGSAARAWSVGGIEEHDLLRRARELDEMRKAKRRRR